MAWVLAVIGAVAFGVVVWLVHHVRREVLRRAQIARVRAALTRPGQVSVAELRARCGADTLRRYPTPIGTAGVPDPAVPTGSISERAA
ncbi:hypothetical protein [Umezawaea sp. Da 62-37]|uniref:hypothetical protein n=1 Tax=Umezawaea sp. Da 62-37 TaxID=3075927 RepID=UPI0028F735DA|nr:hypothetical protein [Umezawaea sp. Da 62-37]WNV83704.1 hypothetical protein RM788_36810 [Umezawaea sp. Da 62-37]